jgi:hypothetical protein
MSTSRYLISVLIGFALVLLGAVLPFLIIMQVLESTFFLNFLAFGASTAGLFIGIIGAVMYSREKRSKD